jgi:hypothetical protein
MCPARCSRSHQDSPSPCGECEREHGTIHSALSGAIRMLRPLAAAHAAPRAPTAPSRLRHNPNRTSVAIGHSTKPRIELTTRMSKRWYSHETRGPFQINGVSSFAAYANHFSFQRRRIRSPLIPRAKGAPKKLPRSGRSRILPAAGIRPVASSNCQRISWFVTAERVRKGYSSEGDDIASKTGRSRDVQKCILVAGISLMRQINRARPSCFVGHLPEMEVPIEVFFTFMALPCAWKTLLVDRKLRPLSLKPPSTVDCPIASAPGAGSMRRSLGGASIIRRRRLRSGFCYNPITTIGTKDLRRSPLPFPVIGSRLRSNGRPR